MLESCPQLTLKPKRLRSAGAWAMLTETRHPPGPLHFEGAGNYHSSNILRPKDQKHDDRFGGRISDAGKSDDLFQCLGKSKQRLCGAPVSKAGA